MTTASSNNAKEIVGKKIKRLREDKGMTQQQLADIVGGDRQYINSIESGKKNVTLDKLEKISTALNVPISEFINVN